MKPPTPTSLAGADGEPNTGTEGVPRTCANKERAAATVPSPRAGADEERAVVAVLSPRASADVELEVLMVPDVADLVVESKDIARTSQSGETRHRKAAWKKSPRRRGVTRWKEGGRDHVSESRAEDGSGAKSCGFSKNRGRWGGVAEGKGAKR
jgi:hypothetical protein